MSNNDLISREALKEALHNEIGDHALSITIDRLIDKAPPVETSKIEYKAYNEGFKDGVDQGIKLSERPQGKWINQFIGVNECVMCSECKLHSDIGTNFCSNCGADMRSVDERLQERAISDLHTAIEDTYKKLGGAE